MKTREEILNGLEEQYNKEFANNGYPSEFKAQASLVQCNFGGLLKIDGNTGESTIVWCDWSDTALDETLTECEIEYIEDEDNTDGDLVSAINYKGTYYPLSSFMNHDH